MDNKIFFEKNIIEINGNKQVFQYNISEIKEIDDYVVVSLSVPMNQPLDYDDFCNVYCLDNQGMLRWQIKNVKPIHNPNFQPAPIVLLSVLGNSLTVTDFMGRKYSVHLISGEMRMIGISK